MSFCIKTIASFAPIIGAIITTLGVLSAAYWARTAFFSQKLWEERAELFDSIIDHLHNTTVGQRARVEVPNSLTSEEVTALEERSKLAMNELHALRVRSEFILGGKVTERLELFAHAHAQAFELPGSNLDQRAAAIQAAVSCIQDIVQEGRKALGISTYPDAIRLRARLVSAARFLRLRSG